MTLATAGGAGIPVGDVGCLGDAQVVGFVAGALDAETLAAVDEHLDKCATCRQLVIHVLHAEGSGASDQAERDRATGPGEALNLPAGARIGRFEIVKVIGRGAMGVVYAARDAKLSRTVALKLVRATRRERGGSESLLDEARAMAQLAHPNVAPVYEAGEVDGGQGEVYIAMEHVAGTTLREWLTIRRSWRDVVDLLAAAGKGLSAAHSAGIRHRDFKPENVLVGEDGRPRVSDFGLAHVGAVAIGGDTKLSGRTRSLVAGTPVYMAPELFSGERATARSDQFSFCVTLFEALAGTRPFSGEDVESLAECAGAGKFSWPKRCPAPRNVRSIVDRGLRADPAERWPDMDALLSALARTRSRTGLMAGAIGGGAAIAGIGAVVIALAGGNDRQDPCRAAADPLARTWNAQRATALATAFGPAAEPLAELTIERIDAYAADWTAMRIDSCAATYRHHSQSPDLLDRRTLCLDRRLSELDATAEQLIAGGSKTAVDGPRRIAELTALSACADTEALLASIAPPPDAATRARVAQVQAKVDGALALDDAGRSQEAYGVATAAVEAARAIGYDPLIAEALHVLAGVEQTLRKLDESAAHLDEALAIAARARDHHRVANISVGKLYLFGGVKQDFAAALALIEPARAAVLQAGADPLQLGSLHMNAGVIYDLAGKGDQAEIELEKALALFEHNADRDAPRIGQVVHNLGALALDRGDRKRARAMFERALAERERVLGPTHPEVAETLLGLGALARRENELAAASAHYQRAAAIYESAYGPDHAQLGAVYNNLAIVETTEGDHVTAETYHRKSLAIRRAAYGENHVLVAQSLGGLGNVISSQGRHQEALEYFEQSLALRREAYPDRHPGIAIGLHNLATGLSGAGRHQEAVAHRAEALAILAGQKVDAADIAEIQFAQAKDLAALSRHREARALAEKAREGFASAGQSASAPRAEVEAWIAQRSATAKR